MRRHDGRARPVTALGAPVLFGLALGLLAGSGEALAGTGGAAFASGITTLTGWIGGDLGETLFFGALIVGGISAALFRAWGVMAGVFALGLLMVVAGPVSAALFGATLPVLPAPTP